MLMLVLKRVRMRMGLGMHLGVGVRVGMWMGVWVRMRMEMGWVRMQLARWGLVVLAQVRRRLLTRLTLVVARLAPLVGGEAVRGRRMTGRHGIVLAMVSQLP